MAGWRLGRQHVAFMEFRKSLAKIYKQLGASKMLNSAATEWEFPRLMVVEAKLVVNLASKIVGYWRYPVVSLFQ